MPTVADTNFDLLSFGISALDQAGATKKLSGDPEELFEKQEVIGKGSFGVVYRGYVQFGFRLLLALLLGPISLGCEFIDSF